MNLDLEKTPAQIFSKNLVAIKYIQHIQDDLAVHDIDKLSIKIQFLNQAYVLHLVAFWQTFHQELARFAFRKLFHLEAAKSSRDAEQIKLHDEIRRFNTPSEKI